MRGLATVLAGLMALAPAAQAACGGDFGHFKAGLVSEAVQKGFDRGVAERFLASARVDPKVIRADRGQGIFQSGFIDFSRKLISQNRVTRGQQMARKWDAVFDRIERDYGISRGVLLAFWAFETDYGAVQGDFNTLNALVTLAHDCRRPDLFRPQIFAAMQLYLNDDFDPQRTTGAWAGEIGMVQMLPADILESGVDGDGDGHVLLKTSAPDALMSGARMLSGLGWRKGEPWLQEVTLPANFDWSLTGLEGRKTGRDWARLGVAPRGGAFLRSDLPSSILIPQGHKGPAFVAYPNFNVYFEWNQSFTYVLTAAYFATRLEGGPVYQAGNPEPGLSGAQMQDLQRKLARRGYDVGDIDGILGAKTRDAVRAVQGQLGLPVDAWPTPGLLSRL